MEISRIGILKTDYLNILNWLSGGGGVIAPSLSPLTMPLPRGAKYAIFKSGYQDLKFKNVLTYWYTYSYKYNKKINKFCCCNELIIKYFYFISTLIQNSPTKVYVPILF